MIIIHTAIFTVPKFIINMSSNIRFVEGDNFTLTSTATGKLSDVDIRWLFNGVSIPTSRFNHMEGYSTISSDLTFTNVTPFDDGIYEALLVWNNLQCSSYHRRSPLNLNQVVLAKAKAEVKYYGKLKLMLSSLLLVK